MKGHNNKSEIEVDTPRRNYGNFAWGLSAAFKNLLWYELCHYKAAAAPSWVASFFLHWYPNGCIISSAKCKGDWLLLPVTAVSALLTDSSVFPHVLRLKRFTSKIYQDLSFTFKICSCKIVSEKRGMMYDIQECNITATLQQHTYFAQLFTSFPQDLLKYTPETHPDHEILREALRLTQNFLTHLSMLHTEAMFPVSRVPEKCRGKEDAVRERVFLFSFIQRRLCFPALIGTSLTMVIMING